MALRLGHAERVKQLYRHSLKTLLSWAVRRELFWEEVNLSAVFGCKEGVETNPTPELCGQRQAAQLRSEFDRNALVVRIFQALLGLMRLLLRV